MIKSKLPNELLDVTDDYLTNNDLYTTTIEITTKCNWKCKHCYLPQHNDKGLDTEKIFELLSELRQLGVYDIVLTGGELFTRKDIMHIIRKIRNMHFRLTLFTNLSLLNSDIIKELSYCCLDKITCTIFSLDEKIHDYITGVPGSLKNTMKNIEHIIFKKIPLEVKTVITKYNVNSYESIREFCKNKGVMFALDFVILPLSDGNCSNYELKIDNEQMFKYIERLDEIKGFEALQNEDDFLCSDLKFSIYIKSNGDVNPCPAWPHKLGNVLEQSVFKIWNSNETMSVRNLKKKNRKDCINCDKFNYCTFCPGTAMLETGDMLNKYSSACELSKIRKQVCKEK